MPRGIGSTTPKNAPQHFYVYRRSPVSPHLVMSTSATFGSRYSNFWESFNQDPSKIAIRLRGNQELSHSDCSDYNDINNNGDKFEEHNNLEDAYNSFDCGDNFDGPDIFDNGGFEDHGDYGFDDGGYDNYQEEDFYGYNEDPY
ncbi:hypothetical protein PCANC_00608 [Puccinia coronata f. sp. avenae]|uniref:Uncharacterized protein n=1 Tax=Puccinia coronata f. sp. avenae TaxID=200324 RepID=A0A2N5W876_9BASI|nr:hypothetical protein PCANC_00608 [Puccinia coronata f. sp. avenae]